MYAHRHNFQLFKLLVPLSVQGKIRVNSAKRGLLICSLNAPSILKHKDEIDTLIRDNKIDILAINETKLDNRVKDETVAISV